jgi:chromosome segregation protein
LEVFGFKSFARKTNIDFHDGMTAIVGPNGCGKSNVVDAIRWVLGEQRAGLLRSENMQNVIFNGTRTQKPLGMAEVSLTIQNSRSVLPIEYSEVVITRRLFRSGESQYLLNQSPCRLKDIVDLFLDTGMGSNAYSVIELSMVEKILNGKPEERRQIFEEAAGVTKYKIRRKAAFRKLEATEQDLIRLSDIVSEVEKTTNSLRRQVNKAIRYRDSSQELRQLELDYSACNLAKIQQELEPLHVKLQEALAQREQISSELATKEAGVETKHVQILELEQQLNARGAVFSANQQRIREKEEEILVCQERINALKTARERATREIDELAKKAEEIFNEKSEVAAKLDGLRSQLQQTETALNDARAGLAEARAGYTKKRSEGKELETARLHQVEEIALFQKNEERLRTHLEHAEERVKGIENERSQIDSQIRELAEKVSELRSQKQVLQEQAEALAEEISVKTRDLDLTRESIEQRKTGILALQGEITTRRDRAGLLHKVLETYEDYPEGVRYLMLEEALPKGFYGTLSDLLEVDEKYQKAIEVALGDAAVAVVVDGALNAVQAIDRLKTEKKGAVTFLPIDNFAGDGEISKEALEDEQGIVGWATDLIKVRAEFREIVAGLLSKTLVVEEITTALEIAPRFKGRQVSIVTLEGEIVYAWGALRGGHSGDTTANMLGRKEMLDTLADEIAKLERDLSEERNQLENQNNRARMFSADLQALQKKKDDTATSLRNVEIAYGQSDAELKRLQQRKIGLDEEKETLAEQTAELQKEFSAIRPSIENYLEKKHAMESAYDSFQRALGELENLLKEKEAKAQSSHVDFVRIQADVTGCEQELNRLDRAAGEVEAGIVRRKEEIQTALHQTEELENRIEELREVLQDDFAERKELEEILEEINQRHRSIKEEIDAQEKALKSVRARRDELSDALHGMELRISELKMNRANLVEQMQENYEVDLKKHPAPEKIDEAASVSRINDLKQKIRAMGPVNMLALKDYKTEKERLDFLLAQKADLLEAEDNLKETIRVINNNVYERFNVVFSKVRENFIQVFKSFFENGAADLRLADDDPLEAEIIIEASPKGKKLGSLGLLSGGEKTLTAISLLFAIYLVKPSPFCVLDEVDAPLDDANIGRFTKALEKFSNNTQFIVVTHNKLTMNAARQLYGITMEEPGVSKIVSVQFEEMDQMKPGAEAEAEQN